MPRLLLFIELLTRDRTVNCGMQSTAATELTAAARAASVTEPWVVTLLLHDIAMFSVIFLGIFL